MKCMYIKLIVYPNDMISMSNVTSKVYEIIGFSISTIRTICVFLSLDYSVVPLLQGVDLKETVINER